MRGTVYKGAVCTVTPALAKKFKGNTGQLIRSEFGRQYNEIGFVALDFMDDEGKTLVSRERINALLSAEGALGKLEYNKDDITTKYTSPVGGTGWRQTFRTHDKKKKTEILATVLQKATAAWNRKTKQSVHKQQMAMEMDLRKPEIIQEAHDNESVSYGEIFPITVGPMPIDDPDNPIPDFECPIDLYALAPESEVVYFNIVGLDGLVKPYLYVGEDGTFTVFHIEDAGLNSSFLCLGPGVKYWLIVPRNQVSKFFRLYGDAVEKKVTKCGHEYLFKQVSPSIELLLKNGIDVWIFELKFGQLAVINNCTPHEVHNGGPVVGITRNFVGDDWPQTCAEMCLLAREHCRLYGLDLGTRENFEIMTPYLKDLYDRMTNLDEETVGILDSRSRTVEKRGAWFSPSPNFAAQFNPVSIGKVFPKCSVLMLNLDKTSIYDDQKRHFLTCTRSSNTVKVQTDKSVAPVEKPKKRRFVPAPDSASPYKMVECRGEFVESKYPCSICEYGGRDRCALKRHMLTHTDQEKKFQCVDCGMMFLRQQYLDVHIRKNCKATNISAK